MDIKDLVPPDERRVGYLVSLEGISLADQDDGTATSWIHAMPIGEYEHPFYGKIAFTAERIERFAAGVMSKVRGIDISIDYSHDALGEAAGWVTAADSRPGGLWLMVQWTKEAASKIREKKYRYFSPEFADEWKDAKGKTHQDVLIGGGLTNRPFLKDLLPVNLSEVLGKQEKEEVLSMSDELLSSIRKALELGDKATDEELLKALTELRTPPKPAPEPKKDPPADPPAVMTESEKRTQEENKQLLERIDALEAGAQLREVTSRLKEWQRGGEAGKYGLPPALNEEVQSVLLSMPSALVPKVTEMLDKIIEKGLVPLQETPVRRKPLGEGGDETATEAFLKRVKELTGDDMDEVEAYAEASRDADLYGAYRDEQHALAEEEEEVA